MFHQGNDLSIAAPGEVCSKLDGMFFLTWGFGVATVGVSPDVVT